MVTSASKYSATDVITQSSQAESIASVEREVIPVVKIAQVVLGRVEGPTVSVKKRAVCDLLDNVEERASKIRKLEDDKKVAAEVTGNEIVEGVDDETKVKIEKLKEELLSKLKLWHEAMLSCLTGITLFLHRKILNSEVRGLEKEVKEVTDFEEFKDILVKYRGSILAKGAYLTGKAVKGELSKGLGILDEMISSIPANKAEEKTLPT